MRDYIRLSVKEESSATDITCGVLWPSEDTAPPTPDEKKSPSNNLFRSTPYHKPDATSRPERKSWINHLQRSEHRSDIRAP